MTYEVIIVGSGPGGSTAARELARRGRRVLLLDRAEFPRDKPCGGAVSPRTAALLGIDISEVVEHTVTGVILGTPATGLTVHDGTWVIGEMTERRRLDAFLVDHAVRAGAEFASKRSVQSVHRLVDGSFEVRFEEPDAAPLSAPAVIGADGANGIVGESLDLDPPAEYGVALEASLPMPDGLPAWLCGRMALTVPVLPGGYGWVFPKGLHINIGVGGREGASHHLRDALDRYVRAFGWQPSALEHERGHRLPLRQPGMRVVNGGAALVGDAAGLVDPLLGEGIYGAVYSGLAAARTIDAYLDGRVTDLSRYQREIDEELGPRLSRSKLLADILAAWPTELNALAANVPGAWDAMSALALGRVPGTASMRGGGLIDALAPLAAFARHRTADREGRDQEP